MLQFTRYLRTVTVAALILSIATAAVKNYVVRDTSGLDIFTALAVILLYYFISIASGYMMTQAGEKTGRAFLTHFMLAGAAKLLLYFSALLICLYLHATAVPEIILLFAACYIVFAVTERTFVMKTLRQ